IIPSEDAHLSEYAAPCDRRREFISGFTGSAGVAVVGLDTARLFTDSRYWIQAGQELDNNWTLHRVGEPGVKNYVQWLARRPPGSKVGIDSRLISREAAVSLTAALKDAGSRLGFPRLNLIDQIWGRDRPPKDRSEIFVHELQFCGQPAEQKLHAIRLWIKSLRRTMPPCATFITNLASIAWVLNIRGHDAPFSPVVQAYLFVSLSTAILFIDQAKLKNEETLTYLKGLGVSVRDYQDTWSFLRRAEWGTGKVLIDATTPYAVALMLTNSRYMIAPSFIEEAKAIKNEVEIEGFKRAYLRDGAAYVQFLAWLEETAVTKGERVTEWIAAVMLTGFREKLQHYWGLAYENISASGANAALPHYRPSRTNSALIDMSTPYLNDSGGNYKDGTCDTTRTIHLGNPTDEQMEAFTRVLQGHIAIDTAIFPEGTTGQQLDVLARRALWKDGLNYGHGTGHGFGQFLNVHEGPQGFGYAFPFKPGHVLTNEPGFYKEGEFGIRIESALVVKRVTTRGKFGGDIWLGFERLTQVPIQTKMVKWDLLSKEERQWVKDHNNQCCARLLPVLESLGDKRASRWLRKETLRQHNTTAAGVQIEWD
ncbi:hypothetical protein BOTBODRAFT_120412, partial [Botryobasidium botryosum FD-172 SS1]